MYFYMDKKYGSQTHDLTDIGMKYSKQQIITVLQNPGSATAKYSKGFICMLMQIGGVQIFQSIQSVEMQFPLEIHRFYY